MRQEKQFKSGFVALCGKPNAGKSTFLNTLFKEKLVIVSPKPQTTRNVISLIYTKENFQIIFQDTPGLFEPEYLMQEMMVKAAYKTLEDSDLVLFLTEPEIPDEFAGNLLDALFRKTKNVMLAVNKIDKLTQSSDVEKIKDAFRKIHSFKEIFEISALTGKGVPELIEKIVLALPEGPALYDKEQLTLQNERFFVQELVREKIFMHYREEIPYSAAVLVDKFEENKGRKDHIVATIYVEKDSQKGILIGENGKALKHIGKEARKDIESFLQRPVYLELWVKVKPKWRKNAGDLKELGLQDT